MTGTSLPLELVLAVAEHLDQHELASFVRTCRAFHGVAEPLLYKHMRIPIDTDAEALLAVLGARGAAIPSSHPLIRYAATVQSVDFTDSQDSGVWYLKSDDKMTPHARREYRFMHLFFGSLHLFTNMHSMYLPGSESTYHNGSMTSSMWVALTRLPNLQSIYLTSLAVLGHARRVKAVREFAERKELYWKMDPKEEGYRRFSG